MAKLLSSPKYHPTEWHTSNQTNYNLSETERTKSERLRLECDRLRSELEDTTKRVQKEVEHRFSQRIQDIQFWRSELEEKIDQVGQEAQAMVDSKAQLEKALEETSFPLEVAKNCLMFREKRESIDLVHDEVEIQLMKEVEVIEGVQLLLQNTHEEAVEQIRLLRSCRYKLQKDLTDKFGALDIDGRCAELTDRTPGLGYSPAAVKVQSNSITPSEWQEISNVNICKAEQERIASTTLRGVIAGLLGQTREDILKQRRTVNDAFCKRIQEMTEAKTTLEGHLNETIKEIDSQDKNIESLQEAIHEKTGPMQLSQTRLDLRSYRPNNELVRDPVQYKLVDEVKEIEDSVRFLQQHYAQSQQALKKLNRNQLILEEDIAIKTNSLQIDQDQCMSLRKELAT